MLKYLTAPQHHFGNSYQWFTRSLINCNLKSSLLKHCPFSTMTAIESAGILNQSESLAKTDLPVTGQHKADHIHGCTIPEFYFENGLRKVYPYYYSFTTYTKERWLGKLLKNVLIDEYRGSSADSVIRDFKLGRITVNGCAVGEDHVLDHNEYIQRTVHRHELPVLDVPIDIVYEDSEILVVNKPPSLPIHPCGRFNRNSLSYLLEKEHRRPDLHIVHRLDRMTSGVLIIGKSAGTAARLSGLVRDREVQKWYLARVEGRFPDAATDSPASEAAPSDHGAVVCDRPLGPISRKLGLQAVLPEDEGGKASKSLFRRLSYNGRTSLVECQPLTGRTHQLRVHLQYLGHPIANDPLYNSDVWGPEKGRGGRFGKPKAQLVEDLTRIHDSDNFLLSLRRNSDQPTQSPSGESPTEAKRPKLLISSSLSRVSGYESRDSNNPGQKFDAQYWQPDANCDDCRLEFSYREPGYNELALFLHAARYRGPEFDYCAPMPPWAEDDFQCSEFV